MTKKINIIGAGIAGLSAGTYLQKNGYETRIYEMHSISGGLCTAWHRKGYIFDGCVHWLVGSNPQSAFYKFWNELINMNDIAFVDYDQYMAIEDLQGNTIHFYTNIDQLEKELLDKAPEDEALIKDFIAGIRRFSSFEMHNDKAMELFNFFDSVGFLMKVIPYMGLFGKWMKISAAGFAQKCKNPLLKKAFMYSFEPEMAVGFLMMTLAWMNNKDAGYPIGGSLKLARMMEQAYKDHGGEIIYNAKVEKILHQDHKAIGIQLENGKIIKSDYVISAADGHATIYDMLSGKYVNEKINNIYKRYLTFPSVIQVSIGIKKALANKTTFSVIPLEEKIDVDPQTTWDNISVRSIAYDPEVATEGHSVVIVMMTTYNYQYWQYLRQNRKKQYAREKERIAKAVINTIIKRYRLKNSDIDTSDVYTPASVIRYTNNWKGSYEGWQLTPEIAMRRIPKTLPGLQDFYMAGHWVEPGGGLPMALMSGRNVAQIICKKDKKKFRGSD